MTRLTPADRATLWDLSQRYAAAADERDTDTICALFTADGCMRVADPPHSLEPVHEHRGRPAIAEVMAALHATTFTQHALANARYEATDTGARGRVRGAAYHVVPGLEGLVDLVWHLHYDDTYVRTAPHEWALAERSVTIDWIERRTVALARADAPKERS